MFVQESSLFDGCPCSGCHLAGMYRLLKQMEDNGLVSGEQGPGRTVGKRSFTLTARGQACLATWAGTLDRYQEDIACIVSFLRRGKVGGDHS